MTCSMNEFRLLVVDDDLVERRIIAKLGSQAGFIAVEAKSFEEAEHELKREKFDCISLDLSLGTQSGALLLRTIVDTGSFAPVVIVSSSEEYIARKTLEIAKTLGLDAELMPKPLSLRELRSIFTRRRNGAVAARGNAQMSAFMADPSGT